MITKTDRIFFLLLFLLTLASLFIGRYPLPKPITDFREDQLFISLLTRIRIPRIISAVLVGISLAVSGMIMQTVFRNPLADPGILGVSQASGFGAALGIILGGGTTFWVQFSSFSFAMIALIFVILISRTIKGMSVLSLVLAGIAVSAFFSAGLGVLKYIADPIDQLPSIVYWLLGSLANSNWDSIIRTLLITIPLLIFFWLYRWRLNIHAIDQEVAFSLGLKGNLETYLVLACSVLLTSSIIAISGIVGWIGLIVPNFARVVVSSATHKSMPTVITMGGIFALLCDNLARTLIPGEIPIGIFTAFIGSLLFIYLLINHRKEMK